MTPSLVFRGTFVIDLLLAHREREKAVRRNSQKKMLDDLSK